VLRKRHYSKWKGGKARERDDGAAMIVIGTWFPGRCHWPLLPKSSGQGLRGAQNALRGNTEISAGPDSSFRTQSGFGAVGRLGFSKSSTRGKGGWDKITGPTIEGEGTTCCLWFERSTQDFPRLDSRKTALEKFTRGRFMECKSQDEDGSSIPAAAVWPYNGA